jgi:hypothetical protein
MTITPTNIGDDKLPDVSVIEIDPQPILQKNDIGLWIDPNRLREILGEKQREPNRA